MAPAPQTGEGWSRPSTAERRGMETSRYRRAERDGIAPTQIVERDGLALVPPNGEGWKRPDTVERKGMGSHRHRRVERDGPSTANRRGMVSP